MPIRLRPLRPAMALLLALSASAALAAGGMIHPVKLWLTAGQNLQNTRFQEKDSQLNRQHLHRLGVDWVFETDGNISATATVDEHFVYVTDFGGSLHKVRRSDGGAEWSVSIAAYTGVPGDFSRSSPALWEDLVVVGDMGGHFARGAKVLGIDRETGALRWLTQVDTHIAAKITQSAVVHDGVVYVGVSSAESGFAASPGYPCCSFRGSLLALDAATGAILWQTYFAPEPPPGHDLSVDGPWYSGVSVWGSTVAIDEARNSLYVSTGQNYTLPPPVLDCIQDAVDTGGDPRPCNDPTNLFDSVIALDLDTGAVRWGRPALPFDAWNVACLFGPLENCPSPTGPDFDFGQGPILFTTDDGLDLVGCGQKSGTYWAHDAGTGDVVWTTQVAPGGLGGGLQWGSSTDGKRVYVAEANSDGKPWTLVKPSPDSVPSTFGGGWSALDAATGEILWQAADPLGSVAWSPTTINKDGLLFVCAMDDDGHMYVLDGETGERLWSFASGGSCVAGAALVDKSVYWGSGYQGPGPIGTPNNQLYAFRRMP